MTKLIGLEAVTSGEDAAEMSLEEALRIARKFGANLRFLRLGGPTKFREQVIAVLTKNRKATPAVEALLDETIPAIEFILADPSADPFLTRMDLEGKGNKDIWRVRSQVLDFASGLLRLSSLRNPSGPPAITVGVHRCDLLWNLCIIGEDRVVARAYYRSAKGHDRHGADIKLRATGKAKLAESFISYYNAVSVAPGTALLTSEAAVSSLTGWPSLFKGNAVFKSRSGAAWVKVVADQTGQKAEEAWLKTAAHEAEGCNFFRPAKWVDHGDSLENLRGGFAIGMTPVSGITAEQLLFEAQRLARDNPRARVKLQQFVSIVVDQAFAALQEFRHIREVVKRGRGWPLSERPYPWPDKLTMALDEAGRYLCRDAKLLAEVRVEARALGDELQASATVPFRDAHLKNRLVDVEQAWKSRWSLFLDWLGSTTVEDIAEWLRQHTTDIDFETADSLVTLWDDPLHILTSPNLGLDIANPAVSGGGFLNHWKLVPKDSVEKKAMSMTLLCRTLRELCRRAWYARVMPGTYQSRYRTEKAGYFLGAGQKAAEGLHNCNAIQRLLATCARDAILIWPGDHDWKEPARATIDVVPAIHKRQGGNRVVAVQSPNLAFPRSSGIGY
jgi:hypothetical protein